MTEEWADSAEGQQARLQEYEDLRDGAEKAEGGGPMTEPTPRAKDCAGCSELLATIREIEELYNTDGVAQPNGHRIEKLFDRCLHGDSEIVPPLVQRLRAEIEQKDAEIARLQQAGNAEIQPWVAFGQRVGHALGLPPTLYKDTATFHDVLVGEIERLRSAQPKEER